MTQLQYARLVRAMHRMTGWCFMASIVFVPLGIWMLRRGNRIFKAARVAEGYELETEIAQDGKSASETELTLDEDFESSTDLAFDDAMYLEEET